MDQQNTSRINKKYDRVMPRVYSWSRSSLKSNSFVMRHDTPSSVRFSGKPSVSNVNHSFSELPIVLNDYNPDSLERPVKRTFVVKPRRTIKSLDPALSPPRPAAPASRDFNKKSHNLRAGVYKRLALTRDREKWPDSQSHSKLKDLKEEIQAYHDTEKLMKLRSHLYQSCGVVLDDVGQPAADKAVQVESSDCQKGTNEENDNIKR